MLTDIDDSEVVRAERRLREDRIALDVALLELKRRSRRSFTSPATIAVLLIAGSIAGAFRSKRSTNGARKDASKVGGILRSLWSPLIKSLAAVAVQRIVRGHDAGGAPAGRPYQDHAS